MNHAHVPGRLAVPLLTALYGALVVVANARNDPITTDFTREWVLFGGDSDFPGDFGRNVFAGSVALGVLFFVLAVTVWFTSGRRAALGPAALFAVLAGLLVLTYRDDGNLLAARPAAAGVMLAVSLYLGSTAASRHRSEPQGDQAADLTGDATSQHL